MNGGIGMSGTIVKHLVDGEICFLGSFGLFMGNGAECHKQGDIDASGILQNGTDDLLDTGDTRFVKVRQFVE